MKNRTEGPRRRPPRKLKTLDLSALVAFNKVKAWVKKNEPEHYGAFQSKATRTGGSGARPYGALQATSGSGKKRRCAKKK